MSMVDALSELTLLGLHLIAYHSDTQILQRYRVGSSLGLPE